MPPLPGVASGVAMTFAEILVPLQLKYWNNGVAVTLFLIMVDDPVPPKMF